MFTGLIEEVGRLTAAEPRDRGKVLRIAANKVLQDLNLGDSVAVSGVCQTVTSQGPGWFCVEAVGDTLNKTTLGALPPGSPVNLERACRADSRLGGHFVLGHVNGVGRVTGWQQNGEAWALEVAPPPELFKYLVAEGSVTVNGISLTVAQTGPASFRVNVIPQTRQNTDLQFLAVGDAVNLEVDILAKYLEGLLASGSAGSGLDESRLRQWGYA